MPDDDASKAVEQQPAQQGPASEMVNPPAPPDSPNSPIGQPASQQAMQADVKDIEDRLKRAERWMIAPTVAIAFFTLGSVVVGILQWSAMSGQLGEMKSGGKDTHDLAVPAGKQADMLVLGQRPWVKIKHRIVSPLTFNVASEDGLIASMTVETTMENVGQSVALNLLQWEDIFPVVQDRE